MNAQYLSVHVVHDFIVNRPPSVNSLDDRVIAQKIVYLAGQMGVQCGDYEFSWYKKGPYSPALTRVLYDERHNQSNIDTSQFKIKDALKDQLLPLKQAIEQNRLGLSEADWIELLASVHFLYEEYSYLGLKFVLDKLVSEKPKYERFQAKYALDILAKIGIVD
ncbi:hypothetical protein P9D34_19425 [Bacillus swezeyi]|uniref:DUF4065 domain-containing protein n=1 Tax=Bacillus swezeyi TaxID=1925020 RepID=A0A1R1RP34_9BACI|nr:hypothetical protein [Bacillus swezeyi]MEC1262552.1 hypothetical protein [Bacillus swezeyi]MED2926739.1 hypothetical protein [Bacillus swezeyi]MED2943482.1 hypothetical protein [Bacillus swezeyi]MED2965699.1 hypothetical protein [Bacillus swezeyi]MED3070898.1 hypothetical protein [Bacillus swezeyi]